LKQLVLLIDDPNRFALDALLSQLLLEACPLRSFRPRRKGGLFIHFVDGVNGRHPDEAGPFSCCDLNGHGIHATDGGVEDKSSQHINVWHKRANKSRSFCGRDIM
jgi:hypothetical protein